MITKAELDAYAKFRVLQNRGHAEKDYFQNMLLFIIYQRFGKEWVFKGGTALQKCFGLPRFSEDLDFTCSEKPMPAFLEESLERFKIEYELEKEEYSDALKWTLRLQGPLYNGTRNSRCKLILDISLREPLLSPPEIKNLGRYLEEIPVFEVFVMQQSEIAAEKVRAILTREQARDVYDFWFLLKNNAVLDKAMIEKKLAYYKKAWHQNEFLRALNAKEKIWLTELTPLVSATLPSFAEVRKEILHKMNA